MSNGAAFEAALSWPAIFGFLAVMLAAMQGVLVLESSAASRISFQKAGLLLGLEAGEIVVVLISEAFSFIQLNGALRKRLQWLHWVAPCLLVIGLSELLLDTMFTYMTCFSSRVRWKPFFLVSGKKGKTRGILPELTPLLLSAATSIVLIGWRQKWWWMANAVDLNIAFEAARNGASLGNGALGFCIGWALFVAVGSLTLFLTTAITVVLDNAGGTVWPKLRYLFYPNEYLKLGQYLMRREITSEIETRFAQLYDLRHGTGSANRLTPESRGELLRRAPLHFGNTVVAPDVESIVNDSGDGWRIIHILLLYAEHFTIFPLLICISVAVSRLYDKLDQDTFEALKELVDVVILVSLVEIAIGVKNFLWGHGTTGVLHEADKFDEDSYVVNI